MLPAFDFAGQHIAVNIAGGQSTMRKYLEPVIWMLALLFLFLMDVSKETPSFCIFKFIGFKSCPGCGIGHAIHYALHFNFKQSIREHIFGIPAAIIILYHIFKSLYQLIKTNPHGPTGNAYDVA